MLQSDNMITWNDLHMSTQWCMNCLGVIWLTHPSWICRTAMNLLCCSTWRSSWNFGHQEISLSYLTIILTKDFWKGVPCFLGCFFFQFTDIHTKSLVNEWWRQKPRTFEKHASITEIHRLSPTMLFSGECRSTEVLLRKWDGIIEKEKRCQHIYIYIYIHVLMCFNMKVCPLSRPSKYWFKI